MKKLTLLFTSVALALVLAGCANTPVPLQNQPDSQVTAAPLGVSRIGLEESKAAFDNGEALFLDVRSKDAYTASHIPGALSIPLAEIETRIDELDPNQWIITYCT